MSSIRYVAPMTTLDAIAFLTIAGLLLAGIRYPGALLAGCLFTYQASELSNLPWLSSAFGGAAVAVSLVQYCAKPVRLSITLADISLMGLVIFLAVSTTWSRDTAASYAQLALLLQSVLGMYGIARFRANNPQHLVYQMLWATMIAGVIFALIMLGERATDNASQALRLTISSDTASVVGLAAPLPFVMLSATILAFMSDRKRTTIVSGICLGISAYVSTVSATRGVFIAYGAGLIVALTLLFKHVQLRRYSYVAFGCVFALLMVVVLMPTEQIDRSIGRLFGNFAGSHVVLDASASERLYAWKTAQSLFSGSPLSGTGYGSFGYYSFVAYPHNMLLEIAAAGGLLGLVFLGLWLTAIGRSLFIVNKNLPVHGAIVVALWVAAFTHLQLSFAFCMGKPLFMLSAFAAALVNIRSSLPGRAGFGISRKVRVQRLALAAKPRQSVVSRFE
jgi:O-antigen ligase